MINYKVCLIVLTSNTEGLLWMSRTPLRKAFYFLVRGRMGEELKGFFGCLERPCGRLSTFWYVEEWAKKYATALRLCDMRRRHRVA
jgi:hypothetical protein